MEPEQWFVLFVAIVFTLVCLIVIVNTIGDLRGDD